MFIHLKFVQSYFQGLNSFEVLYQGEELPCAKGMTEIETKIQFSCNQNATWNTTVLEPHGGAKAPQPLVSFDQNSCQVIFGSISHVFSTTSVCFDYFKIILLCFILA